MITHTADSTGTTDTITKTQSLSLRRLGLFLRFDLLSRRRDQLLPLVVPPALFLLAALFQLAAGTPLVEWPAKSFTVALLLGIAAATVAHRRENEAATASFHLMLPVTHGERFLSRMISTFGIPYFGQLVLLTVLANLVSGLSLALGHAGNGLVLPDGNQVAGTLGTFLLAHSIFFTGGIFFRSSPAIKTALAAMSYVAVLGILAGVLALSHFFGAKGMPSEWNGHMAFSTVNGLDGAGAYARVAWSLVLPALLYTAAFFRSRENEAKE